MSMGRPRFDPRQQQRGFQIRVNHRIRVPEVRVIGADGDMLGVLATHEAMRIAQAAGLDLVEVNPKADPPVCKILDFGKYKYEEKKKTAEAKRKQTVVEIKEIKLRPKTDDHDVAFKTKAARRFLEAGHKVKVTVRFRGREITHPEKAQEQLQLVIAATEDLANIESRAMMEARTMTVLIAPKPQIMQKVAQAKIAAEKARQLAEKEGRPMPSEASLPSMSDLGDDDDDDDDDDEDDEDEDDDVEAPAADASAPAAAKSAPAAAKSAPAAAKSAPAAAKSAPAAAKSAPAVAKGAASEKKSEGGAVEATSGKK
jgi:translation initiation factor IF-3